MSALREALFGRISQYVLRITDMLFPRELWGGLQPSAKSAARRPVESARRVVSRPAPEHGDERTVRRMAEAERGGLSSQESAARYARGENAGGTHRKAVRHEGPAHLRPSLYEPQERKETVPRGERHIAVTRRGA